MRKNQTINDVNEDLNSMYHNMLNMNKLISDLYVQVRNLEGFMSFAEQKLEELSKKE